MALCINGAGRTLSNSRVYTSIPNISSTFEAQGLLQSHIDLFVHVSLGESNLSKMMAAMRYLQPIRVLLSKDRYPVDEKNTSDEFEGPYPVDRYLATPGCHDKFWHYPSVLGKAMNYYYHMKACYEMLEQHEAKTKLQYDVIMFTRADLMWKAGLPEKVIRAAVTRSNVTLQHDFFMVAPRDVATDLANILENYFTVTCVNKGTAHTPEDVVKWAATDSATKHNVSVDWTWEEYKSLFTLVREGEVRAHDPEGY